MNDLNVIYEINFFGTMVTAMSILLNAVEDEGRREAHLKAFITTLVYKMARKKQKAIETLKECIKQLEQDPTEEYPELPPLVLEIVLPEEEKVNGTHIR